MTLRGHSLPPLLAALALLLGAAACSDDDPGVGPRFTPTANPGVSIGQSPAPVPGNVVGSPGGGGGGSAPAPGGIVTVVPGPDTPVTSPPITQPAAPVPSPQPLDPSQQRVLAPIESVDVRIAESFPPQYFAAVTSGLPSGCARFDHYTVDRSGDTVTITLWNRMPADPRMACTMIYGYIEHNIALGSDFQSGRTYTLKVNDVTKTFTAQ
jgi:hypothetical protein